MADFGEYFGEEEQQYASSECSGGSNSPTTEVETAWPIATYEVGNTTHHPEEDPPTIPERQRSDIWCVDCPTQFEDVRSVQAHMKQLHTDKEDGKRKCLLCGANLHKGFVKGHMSLHTLVAITHQCCACNQTVYDNIQLQKDDEKLFLCLYCKLRTTKPSTPNAPRTERQPGESSEEDTARGSNVQQQVGARMRNLTQLPHPPKLHCEDDEIDLLHLIRQGEQLEVDFPELSRNYQQDGEPAYRLD